ncbi:MAG: cytochrome P460 family protein [Woeseiaceae bacterium]|nr:cytochrome P460 family protein [Woeseiaceae bacterium]
MNSEIEASRFRTVVTGMIAAGLLFSAIAVILGGGQPARAADAEWGPKWTSDGKLILPEGYHEWVFLGSPLTPHALNGETAPFPEYHNVYVQPQAFRTYRETGEFPEGTILLKELQLTRERAFPDGSSVEVSGRGYFPAARNGIDISVKDKTRFADSNGWGFFNFGHHAPPYLETAEAAPIDACAGCHIANAEEMVFKKFYRPILDAK